MAQVSHPTTPGGWNARYPVGQLVRVRPDNPDGTPLVTTTRTPAWTQGHGAPVVAVHGLLGGVALLADVQPVESAGLLISPEHAEGGGSRG